MNKLFIKIVKKVLEFKFRNVYVQMKDLYVDDNNTFHFDGIIISWKDFINGNYSREDSNEFYSIDQPSYYWLSYIPLPDTKIWDGKSRVQIIPIRDTRKYIKKYAKYIHRQVVR